MLQIHLRYIKTSMFRDLCYTLWRIQKRTKNQLYLSTFVKDRVLVGHTPQVSSVVLLEWITRNAECIAPGPAVSLGATGSWPQVFLGLLLTTQISKAVYIKDRNFGYIKVLKSKMMQCT